MWYGIHVFAPEMAITEGFFLSQPINSSKRSLIDWHSSRFFSLLERFLKWHLSAYENGYCYQLVISNFEWTRLKLNSAINVNSLSNLFVDMTCCYKKRIQRHTLQWCMLLKYNSHFKTNWDPWTVKCIHHFHVRDIKSSFSFTSICSYNIKTC